MVNKEMINEFLKLNWGKNFIFILVFVVVLSGCIGENREPTTSTILENHTTTTITITSTTSTTIGYAPTMNEMPRSEIINKLKAATFALLLPGPEGMPIESGTAFFISPDGYIITANHVINKINESKDIILMQPVELGKSSGAMVHNIEIIQKWEEYDLAILKADLEKNKNRAFLEGKKEFPYLEIEFNQQEDGEEVYAFGFPLPSVPTINKKNGITIGFQSFSPRLTSAIISSKYNYIGSIQTGNDPKYYSIDKALNYGNSGGPIVLSKNGKVISVCIKFQPVQIRQNQDMVVMIPSLYGITSSLQNIKNDLQEIIS